MTAAKLAAKYNVSVAKFGLLKKNQKWHAYRGGNGTGEPVVELAEAFHLEELEKRIRKSLGIVKAPSSAYQPGDPILY